MKKILTLLVAAGLTFSAALPASAIEFNVEGEWLMGFAVGNSNLVGTTRAAGDAGKQKYSSDDKYSAAQRVRLQLEAVANENLSGTVMFELLETMWGQSETSGALGADGINVGVLNAFIDWAIPDTDFKVRMGLAPIELPNVAGGSSVLNTDSMASVTLSYEASDEVGVTLMWGRPYNDNYSAVDDGTAKDKSSFLDNVDLFALSVPINVDGLEITPWVMYGLIGHNAIRTLDDDEYSGPTDLFAVADPSGLENFNSKKSYSSAFWAGIAASISAFDPINIEVDLNYGYVESMGKFDMTRSDDYVVRADTKREGFLAKALVEYAMDWGTPGIFGWYATGDDDNPKNGSERLPSIEAKGCFTSMLGDDNWGWGSNGAWYDMNLNYAGTWGIGIQIADMSFIEDVSHTFRVAYWGGTNSPEMAKYAEDPISWYGGINDGLYLTTNDSLIEFNLITAYQMYENFEINLELGYLINNFDEDTWKKSAAGVAGDTYSKRDAWKAQLIFAYTF